MSLVVIKTKRSSFSTATQITFRYFHQNSKIETQKQPEIYEITTKPPSPPLLRLILVYNFNFPKDKVADF